MSEYIVSIRWTDERVETLVFSSAYNVMVYVGEHAGEIVEAVAGDAEGRLIPLIDPVGGE